MALQSVSVSKMLLLGSVLGAAAFGASAADVVITSEGVTPYVIDSRNVVARSGADLCWRTGFWSPATAETAMAGEFPAGCQCDADLVPNEKCTIQVAQAPTPTSPETPKPITLSAEALFGFDKAVLTPTGKAAIDREVLSQLSAVGALKTVMVEGHTDRIGSQTHNQALSERRATAVKNHLVEKGVNADLIDVIGFGKTQPVPGISCPDSLGRTKLIECLAPHRRVVVRIQAMPN